MSEIPTVAAIPMKRIGPVRITGPVLDDAVQVPLATYERPLWPSTNRGAKVSRACGGFHVQVVDERMSRSITVEAASLADAVAARDALLARQADVAAVVASTSRFARLKALHVQLVGRLLYVRLEIDSGDAAGHNMVTKAADRLMDWLLGTFETIRYV